MPNRRKMIIKHSFLRYTNALCAGFHTIRVYSFMLRDIVFPIQLRRESLQHDASIVASIMTNE